jgi:uncharacterized protein YgiM (DUF1202 family)
VKIELPDGTIGWISAAYTAGGQSASSHQALNTVHTSVPSSAAAKTTVTTTTQFSSRSSAKLAVNVRSGPSTSHAVVGSISPHGAYRLLGTTAGGWLRVQLPSGTIGYVSSAAIGASSSSSATNSAAAGTNLRKTTTTGVAGTHVLTAGVRIHAYPGLKARVVGGGVAGTHVQILSYRGAWVLVRLASGVTGYVYGSYVK